MKYLLFAVSILVLGYFSIEIKPLDEVKKAEEAFDAATYARNYLEQTLPEAYDEATPILELVKRIQADKDQAFADLSHAVSIGSVRHFLVEGKGTVLEINEDDIQVMLQDEGESLQIQLATEFIYGSSIRDAAGLFDIKAFTSSADMNNVAAEINKMVKEEVIQPYKAGLKVDDQIEFIGALEMNQKYPQFSGLEILPILLK